MLFFIISYFTIYFIFYTILWSLKPKNIAPKCAIWPENSFSGIEKKNFN